MTAVLLVQRIFFLASFASMKSGSSGLYFHGVLKGMPPGGLTLNHYKLWIIDVE